LPKRVFEAIVRCSGEYIIRCSELLQMAKSLELSCVNDPNAQRMHFNVTMNWIIKYLRHI